MNNISIGLFKSRPHRTPGDLRAMWRHHRSDMNAITYLSYMQPDHETPFRNSREARAGTKRSMLHSSMPHNLRHDVSAIQSFCVWITGTGHDRACQFAERRPQLRNDVQLIAPMHFSLQQSCYLECKACGALCRELHAAEQREFMEWVMAMCGEWRYLLGISRYQAE
jgi:hypothetical protein